MQLQSDSREDATASVSQSDRATLDDIFRHPLAHNLAWTDVVALVKHVGHVEERSDNEFVFEIAGQKQHIHKPHSNHLTAPELMELRHFATRAGLSAKVRPTAADPEVTTTQGLIVVIDHREAKIYHIDLAVGDGHRHAIRPHDQRHFVHAPADKDHSSRHREGATDDRKNYELVAGAIAAGGRMVIIGHGKGESSAAHMFSQFLRTHHPETFHRIANALVADLPRLTDPQLLELADQAFGWAESLEPDRKAY
jgi:hypothetical protein